MDLARTQFESCDLIIQEIRLNYSCEWTGLSKPLGNVCSLQLDNDNRLHVCLILGVEFQSQMRP